MITRVHGIFANDDDLIHLETFGNSCDTLCVSGLGKLSPVLIKAIEKGRKNEILK